MASDVEDNDLDMGYADARIYSNNKSLTEQELDEKYGMVEGGPSIYSRVKADTATGSLIGLTIPIPLYHSMCSFFTSSTL
jgi:hypothetical protein